MTETIHIEIEVRGRVQGIGFRYSAINTANRLGIKGYVKNLPNGSVYLEIEGPVEAVNSMIKWCKTGPSTGWVQEVFIKDGTLKSFPDFRIKY